MIKNYLNSDVLTACEMLEVSDKDILEWSRGEVTSNILFNEDNNGDLNFADDALFSKKIFDDPKVESTKMGHISLPIPIVNVQYLRGKKPLLPRLLDMDRKSLESVIEYAMYYNVNTDAVISAKEVTEYNKDVCLQGSIAVEKMLEKKGLSADRYILHNVPVIPAALRFKEAPCKKGFSVSTINMAYEKILNRKKRLAKLLELGSPEIIIINEKRMLEEYVFSLISNGVFSYTSKSCTGEIYKSLDDIADEIKSVFHKKNVSFILDECLKNSGVDPQNLYENIKKSISVVQEYNKDLDKADLYDENGFAKCSQEDLDKHPITLAFKEKHDPVETEIYSDILKIIEAVFYRMFGNYECYKKEFVIAAENNVDHFIDDIHENPDIYMDKGNYTPEEITKHIASLIYLCMDNMKKKRVQWIQFDEYVLSREL